MVQKFYKITNEKYLNELKHQKEVNAERSKFITKIFNEYGIEGKLYRLSGDGGVDCPFREFEKGDIRLYIEDIEHNRNKFNKHFKKSYIDGMLNFRKSSSILKEIQNKCIEEKVIINVPMLRSGDYFKELKLLGYTYMEFNVDDVVYLMIESSNVNTITPEYDGFEEIKASEFYTEKEKYEIK